MSKPILKIEYFVDSDNMSDEEYQNQKFKEFSVTEDMLRNLIEEHVKLESGQKVCDQNFFVSNVK